MKVKAKRNVEIPPEIRTFTERILNTPYENLADGLVGFSWKYDKGDFQHWISLFNYFDAFFEKYTKNRPDLRLENQPDASDPPFPVHNTVALLRVTTLILENCTNKHLYQSYDHLTNLLAAPDHEVVIWALQALVTFLRKTHHSATRFHGCPSLNARLFDLCRGWGGKEQGLDMTACVHDNVSAIENHIQDATTLHFEFYKGKEEDAGLKVIHLENLHHQKLSDHQLLDNLVQEHAVPKDLRFRLLSQIRVASGFGTLEGRRTLIKTRLLAFCVLVQSNPLHEEMLTFFNSEPEFMNELVELIQTEEGVPLDLRTLALRSMTVQLIDRSRHSVVISAVGTGGSNGILAILLQDSIDCICPGDKPSNSSKKTKYNASFVDALLVLIAALISSASGSVALNEAGFIPALLPLIRDRNPSHMTLACTAVKILEGFMDYSSTASALFRTMGGLSTMIARLDAEVHTDEASPSIQAIKRKKSNDEPVKKPVSYLKRLLMKSLLRAIALGSYAPTVGTASRPEEQDARVLYNCLKSIFQRPKEFGGALFAFAATVATDLIHQDPHCFEELNASGVPDAFIEAILEGVIPSSEAICSIPTALIAFCLNATGLQKVTDSQSLRSLITIFTSKQYVKALSGETASILGAGIDELFRHVPTLKDYGIQNVIIQLLRALCLLGGDAEITEEIAQDPSSQMPNEVLERSNQSGVDTLLPECISHTAKMLESLLSNTDTSRKFAQHHGVELLLKFYTLPKLPASFGSSSHSPPLLSIFRSLTHNNCQSLHVCVPVELTKQLEHTQIMAEKLGDVCVPELDAETRETYVRCVASASGLTAAAATIVRTSTPMLTEMCKGDKILISMLGELERSILHQLVNCDSWKERKTNLQKEIEEAVQMASEAMEGVEESELDRTDTEDAMEIEQEYLLPEIAPPLPNDIEMQSMNGVKYHPQRKAPDDLAYEVLQHFVGTVRTVYTSIAKAIHTPARRREETSALPTLRMKAAAVGLALVLRSNLNLELESLQQLPLERFTKHLARLVEEVQLVLFDGRRHCCHTLILNYFIAIQGFASLSKNFEIAMQLLWKSIEEEGQTATTSSANGQTTPEHRADIVTLVSAFLTLFTQLTNPRLLCQSVQTTSLLVVPLPSTDEKEEEATEPNSEASKVFVKNLQNLVLQGILPVWSHSLFSKCPPNITSSVIEILNSCLDGSSSLSAAFRAIPSTGRFGAARSGALDPSMIQQIIEMGFSRARAIQALRRIGQSSVDMALEWLLNHPDEPLPENTESPQEQELAEAMTASLNQIEGPPSEAESSHRPTSESIHVLDLVSNAVSILEKTPNSAFSISSFIMTLCNRNATDRETVIQWFIATLNKTIVDGVDFNRVTSKMNAVAHLLALMMSESALCRELAVEVAMIPAIIRVLDCWERHYKAPSEIPVWMEGLLLVLDFLSQMQPSGRDSSDDDSSESSDAMEESTENSPLSRILSKWAPTGSINESERNHLVDFCIKLLQHLHAYGKDWSVPEKLSSSIADPAGVTQSVLQLLVSITGCHATALQFLHKNGIDLMLNLPASCVLLRHEPHMSSILKHILEDDATLLTMMEMEIKTVFSLQRRPLGQMPFFEWDRMQLRNFLQQTAHLAYRSPNIFNKAIGNLCILAAANGNQMICLKKPKPGSKFNPTSAEKPSAEKTPMDSSRRSNKRIVPNSFVEIIDKLLDRVMSFDVSFKPSFEPESSAASKSSLEASEHPLRVPQTSQDASENDVLPSDVVHRQFMMKHRETILQIMMLNMLSEFCLTYASTVGVLLKRDTELAQREVSTSESHLGLLKKILHEHLAGSRLVVKPNLADKASKFLQAVCVRSHEGRRRILNEIVNVITMTCRARLESNQPIQADSPFVSVHGAPSGVKIKALIDLIGNLLAASSNAKPNHPGNQRSQQATNGLTVELVRSMRQAGVVASLIQALELIEMKHPDASQAVQSIIRPLEILTRSIPVPSKKTMPSETSAATPHPAEGQRSSRGDAFLVPGSSSTARHHTLDLMDDDLHEMHNAADILQADLDHIHDAADLYYEALEDINEMVGDTIEEAMHGNDDPMEDDDDDSESQSESHSSDSHSYQQEGSQEDHVVVDEESVEMENEHEELGASDEEPLEDEDEDLEDGEDDGSADMELDGEEWDEPAFRDYSEALDRIESVMLGGDHGDVFTSRILAHPELIQPNLRSVLDNMLGNFLGSNDENRHNRRAAYRLAAEGRLAANPGFLIQSIPLSQHRLLTRPPAQGNGNEEGNAARAIQDGIGRRFGQIPTGDGRWRRFGFQGLTQFRDIADTTGQGHFFFTGERPGGRQGPGFGLTAAFFDGERRGGEAHPSQRAAGTQWMQRVQNQFESLLRQTLPREEPAPQAALTEAVPDRPANDSEAPVREEPEAQPVSTPPSSTAPYFFPIRPPNDVPPPSEAAPVENPQPVEQRQSSDVEMEDAEDLISSEDDVAMEEDSAPVEPASQPPQPEPAQDSNTSAAQEEPATEDNALPEEIVMHATQAGIDATFLRELPRALQIEVLNQHGVSTVALTHPVQPVEAEGEGNEGNALEGNIDPEFLAALPPEMREEVIESHMLAERRREVERRLTEGHGDDVANMIASLPDDIREEVLLYSDPELLAHLPPNLLAEGQSLRERHTRHLGQDRDVTGQLASNLFFTRLRQNAGQGRDGNRNPFRKDRKEEMEEPPEIEVSGLALLMNLVEMNSSTIKTQLQKLLLNLCVREDCRRHIAQILIQKLRNPETMTSRQAPFLIRRVLEFLAFLARHPNAKVAEALMDVRVAIAEEDNGKLPMPDTSTQPKAIEILLEMLGQSLCLRSVSTLEQDLQLLELVLASASERSRSTEATSSTEAPIASTSQIASPTETLRDLSTDLLGLLPSIIGREGLTDTAYKSAATVIKLIGETAPVHQPFVLMALRSQIDEQTQTACAILYQIGLQGMDRSSLQSLGSRGCILLRILHSVEALLSTPKDDKSESAAQILSGISLSLDRMWSELSPVVSNIEASIKSDGNASSDAATSGKVLPSGASQVLPFIESFFVLCSAEDRLVETKSSSGNSPLMKFAERHRVLLNAFLRQTPGLLEGSFKPLIHSPRLIDFDNKRSYFRSKLRPEERTNYGALRINVRREHVFEDSFYQLRHRSVAELRCKLSVQFTNEEGIDAGGVSREWYQVMAREIFNPNLALFIAVPDGASTFQPNPNSIIQNDRGVNHLDFFKFVGRLVGKAVYDNQLIDAHFTRSFYKHMLNQPLTYQDLEAVDLDFYKQMKWILENDVTDVLMGQTFAAEMDFFGRKEMVELKENGSKIPITETNKKEYVNLMTKHKMTTAIRDQIKAFQEGFWELVPKDLAVIFNDHELELIISGLPEVDVADLKANTEYTGYTAASQVIQWFWSVVEEFDAENLALLLQFVTGTSKVPLDGFANLQGISGPQKFQIHKSYASDDRLPSAHTCFNQIDLPEYKSREKLKDRLLLSIHEAREGFGFG